MLLPINNVLVHPLLRQRTSGHYDMWGPSISGQETAQHSIKLHAGCNNPQGLNSEMNVG